MACGSGVRRTFGPRVGKGAGPPMSADCPGDAHVMAGLSLAATVPLRECDRRVRVASARARGSSPWA
jgi:hypothetical protein